MESTPTVPTTPPNAGTPLDPKEVVEKILAGLAIEATVSVQSLDGAVLVSINTPEPGRLIGRRGQTLSQLQFLVNRILLRAQADAPRVTIDCENYRNRLHDDVLKKVQEAADKVRRWGEPVQIGPFNAFDRRVINQAYQNDAEIEIVSEGGEEDAGTKKITVKLKA